MSRMPDFVIIGAMKAATSTLHDQLDAQRGFFMSDPKEIYFFSDRPVWERGLEWYAAHFAAAAPTDLCGESSTHYAKLPTYPETVSRLAATIPHARFVYVMRDPIDRLVSQYQHMWLQREVTASFDAALEGEVPELVEYSRYHRQLVPYLETFGAERILPVFFDRLRRDPQGELERVARHVGFDGPVRWDDQLGASNVSADRLKSSPLRRRLKALPGYDRARALLPEALVDGLRTPWRPSDRPEPTPAQRAELTTIFDADLARLGELLGVELDTDSFRRVTAASALEWRPETLRRFPAANQAAR